ncbi:hypothetical protein PCANC_25370 [Puccinia coronata f. sp. avenae]|uniref:DNA 3'-5' helicase n=1 Tax=Puccinia coronata f. sp. avenae TaxID=200324 RepID=A0A2N5S6P9_9BASI|nr:hypothetical protein PCANC_25370 [Puccinia coronata f. sp. avenae]PLW08906.1 hypothetical protein PCASD_22291 [Puccinia coronata f. sp. avenae]
MTQVPRPQAREKDISQSVVRIFKKVSEKNDSNLRKELAVRSLQCYKNPAKPLQIEAVFNLVRGKNVFLLAGTGYGKSRIPEMYHKLIPKTIGAVIIVLNPLDTLGDNQVLEKNATGMTAINLTKLTFNSNEAAKIRQGAYQFVYLSPEIFLNSKMWDTVYFSRSFQDRLALVVVDEAHMIYQWGIVESTKAKQVQSSAPGKHEDRGVFRPSYGKLGIHLLARESVPLLLMSATCRPVAVREIKKSLKLDTSNLVMLDGELTQPEIRIIRVTMRCSLGSANDLLSIYPPETQTPDNLLVPTLIYSGSRQRTGRVLDVLAQARQSPELVRSATSTFARRFHSCTGESDKIKAVQDFADGIFPVCSCTMALGMGQNWSRVQSVVHMGRGEPSAVCQMIGRCGQDGRPGLAVLFVEKTRKNGKNKLADFDASASDEQNEDDCMDALAITPVCLRIALAIDNKLYTFVHL